VLCYHAVSAGWTSDLSLPPAVLVRQLRSLLRWYRPVSADQVLDAGRRALHVTFDDAFRSVAVVVPTLRDLQVRATIFACSSYADDGRPLAVPELAEHAAAQPQELATMPWDELRALADDGLEIGSHTSSHPHLTRLDDGELRAELSESRERIEDELRRTCRYLAYPYGEEDARVRAAARAAGYRAAFALRAESRPRDPFGFPRLGVWRNDGVARLTAKIALQAHLRAPTPRDA
jgi:peptidoglycan/xylan/chitin deacetylase (PgdA/CDA1 family)